MLAVATDMMAILKPLDANKTASAVVNEFICAALAGKVSADLLERSFKTIRSEAPVWGTPAPC